MTEVDIIMSPGASLSSLMNVAAPSPLHSQVVARAGGVVETSNVSAVLFAKDLRRVAAFYSGALGFKYTFGDEVHSVLECHGFNLMVHQIPKHIADEITIEQPPTRRVWSAVRLDFPVHSIEESRKLAELLGGAIDDAPPQWADSNASFCVGYDPEGNPFGVRQQDT